MLSAKNLPTSRPTHPPRAEILRRRLLRMTTRSGTMGVSFPERRMFHVKQHPETRCFSSPARGQTIRSRRTNARTTPNARLNLCRRPRDLSRACFDCTTTDRARLASFSGSSSLNLQKPAKIAPFPGFTPARLPNPSEALPYKKPKFPYPPPSDADTPHNSSFLTPLPPHAICFLLLDFPPDLWYNM